MKNYISFLLICLLGMLSIHAQGQTLEEKKQKIIDSVKKVAPKFVNDVSANGIAQTQIFSEVAPTGFDLFNANFNFTDKDQVQKIGFSPLKLLNDPHNGLGILTNLRLNISNKSGQLTSGISIGYDNTAYPTKRVQKLMDKFTEAVNAFPELPPRRADESIEEYKTRTKSYNEALAKLAGSFDDQRLRHIWKITTGYNAQFFAVLKSKSEGSNFDSLNYHGFKGHNLFVNTSYSYNNGWVTLEGAVNYFHKRKAADSIQIRNPYYGFALGITKRIFRLMGEKQLLSNENYLNSRYIPSLYLGFSFEQSKYDGSDYQFAEENTKSWRTYTPYMDVGISPSVQFRLAFPIKKVREYKKGTQGQAIGTVLSFNYKLSSL